MRVPEPLRYSPFRIHRRKSLNSLLYGAGRPAPIRPKGNIAGSYGVPLQSVPSSKTYMSGFPNEYSPHPGFVQIKSNHYQPYDDSAFPNDQRSNQPSLMDEFQMAALELAGFEPRGPKIKYEDCLMTEALFQQLIQSLTQQAEEQLPIPFDNNEVASQIMDAHMGELSDDMPLDSDMNIQRIQMAIEEARCGLFTNTDPEMADEDFYGLELNEIGLEQALQGQPIEEMDYTAAQGPEDLEQMTEANEIEAMDQQVIEEPMDGMEPCLEMDHYGNPMVQPEMYDEQMQYMMGPFMNPYMVPDMMDPYMMHGSFGPMPFGPGPGPSGGP